jgi:hypothetical protein
MTAVSNKSKANTLVNQFTYVFTKENLSYIPKLKQKYQDMPKMHFDELGI